MQITDLWIRNMHIQDIDRLPRVTEDVKAHMEEIKIHMRGHNLYDIYYGRYKEQETELLTKYIEIAPREDLNGSYTLKAGEVGN